MAFGREIAEARKKAGLSQKDLAARIFKEDGTPISPQYLNDIERDRRNPPSQFMLQQFAQQLDVPEDLLLFIAGQFPDDIRSRRYPPEQAIAAMKAFRQALGRKSHEMDQ
jgi:transcriptional regulator with XRE-family HTH domain